MRAFLEDLVAILIYLDRLTTLVLEAFCFDDLFEMSNEFFLIVFNSSLHAGVPVILDGIVGSALEDVGDIRPLVGLIAIKQIQNPLFLP